MRGATCTRRLLVGLVLAAVALATPGTAAAYADSASSPYRCPDDAWASGAAVYVVTAIPTWAGLTTGTGVDDVSLRRGDACGASGTDVAWSNVQVGDFVQVEPTCYCVAGSVAGFDEAQLAGYAVAYDGSAPSGSSSGNTTAQHLLGVVTGPLASNYLLIAAVALVVGVLCLGFRYGWDIFRQAAK